MKFLADHMLGKLARYLRFMGYDTYYPSGDMSDDEILKIARKDGRVILTRDKELARRSGGLYVESEDYRQQLRQVIGFFGLTAERMLTRCSVCNSLLFKVPKGDVFGKVPDYVYSHHEEFYMCPVCKRIYWYGTHTERIKNEIMLAIGDAYENRRKGEERDKDLRG